ncbi:NlpC/P60 family protein [Brevibacterium sp. 50QC2O2]|uniref:NlpC/P60 family protein n=1 Tax=Brevibacterium sp. 50QC2O2 TaxID=2968459 RepID=UPI00211BA70F|nr:NlpC/P60 family protein [Brevibacterium sp. 50QC2O2]MCQ9387393.1 NlpC/P60 family protein [Brevibacterium sp. 50QC2O2]
MKIAMTTAAVCAAALVVSGIALGPVADAAGAARPSFNELSLTDVDHKGLLTPGARNSSPATAAVSKKSTTNMPGALRSTTENRRLSAAEFGASDMALQAAGEAFAAASTSLNSTAEESAKDSGAAGRPAEQGPGEGLSDAGRTAPRQTPQAPRTQNPETKPTPSAEPSSAPSPSISGDVEQQTEDGIKIAAISASLSVPRDRSSVVGVVASGANASNIEVRTQSTSGGWGAWTGLSYDQGADGDQRAGTDPFVVSGASAVQMRILGSSAPADAKLVIIDPKKTAADQAAVNANTPVINQSATTQAAEGQTHSTRPDEQSVPGAAVVNASGTVQATGFPAGTSLGEQAAAVAQGTAGEASGSAGVQNVAAKVKKVAKPSIASRKAWGANESIRRSGPSYADSVKAAVIHHTEGSNNYDAGDVPGIIRGIYTFHVKGRGWADIGYNVLVDKFGRLWQGRAGNVDRPIIGAHVSNFNTGTFGISVLGTYMKKAPSKAAQVAVENTIAWKLSKDGVPAIGKTTVNGKRINRIVGHRDVGDTDCPGDAFYAKIPQIRKAVAAIQSSGKQASTNPITSGEAIQQAYKANAKALGAKVGGETKLAGGSYQQYKSGFITWTAKGGAKLITGEIAKAWNAEVRKRIGLPANNQGKLSAGLYQTFASGSIHWSKATGAHATSGAIKAHWAKKGSEKSHLGYPAGDEQCAGGTCTQRFQGATLFWAEGAGVSEFSAGMADGNAPPISGGAVSTAPSAGTGEGSADNSKKPGKKPAKKKAKKSASQREAEKRAAIVKTARKYVGVPYVWGGTSPTKGWDCSGFVQYVYKKNGIKLPRTSGQQKAAGEVIPRSKAKPGDLIWHPGHITIVSDKPGKLIDAGSRRTGTSERSSKFMFNSGGVVIRVI